MRTVSIADAAVVALDAEIRGDLDRRDTAFRYIIGAPTAKTDLLEAVAAWVGAACRAVGLASDEPLTLDVGLDRPAVDVSQAALSLSTAVMCAVHNRDWFGLFEVWNTADDEELFVASVHVLKIAGLVCRKSGGRIR